MNLNAETFDEFWTAAGVEQEYSLLVTGNSMRPFLFHGRSVVYITKKNRLDLKRGDIILFKRSGGNIVLHRVAGISKDGTITVNGDAQCWTENVRPEQVLACVTGICRKKHVFSVKNPCYRALVALWMAAFPIRPVLLRIWAKLINGKVKLCGKK